MRIITSTGLLVCALLAGTAGAETLAGEDGSPGRALGADPAPAVPGLPAAEATEPSTAAAAAMPQDAGGLRAAIEGALQSVPAASRSAILDFYAARDFAPFWSEGDGERGAALVAALEASGEHGLPEVRYDPATVADALGDAADQAAAEAAASRAFLRYARDLSGGVLTPREVDGEINIDPHRPGDDALLMRLGTGTVTEALAGLAPATPEYRAMLAEKRRLEALAERGGWGAPLADGPALQMGDSDPRVAELRARLDRLGYGPVEAAETSAEERYDADLLAIVERFQRDHGLHDDGVIGPRSLAALNATVEDRIVQTIVNLERMRWLGGNLGERYVYVNIPDYTVTVFEQGEAIYHTRSVVGETRTQTPEFSDKMTYLVVNPTWYIPDSIARRVYLPQLQSDPGVLARNNMRLFTRAGTEINPALVDFTALDGTFPFRIRQNPSASNALGRVKFMFPNQFAIYLHDTPARELFARDARAFSNGCVRLEDPFELAHYLLEPQLDDPEGSFRRWVDAGSERYVTLDEPIDVHITYRTAWIDADGTAHYREDVYGRDDRVFEALAALGVTVQAAQG